MPLSLQQCLSINIRREGLAFTKQYNSCVLLIFFKHKNRHVYKNKVDFGKSSKGKKQSINNFFFFKKPPCIIVIMRPKMKFRLVAVERLKLLYEHLKKKKI